MPRLRYLIDTYFYNILEMIMRYTPLLLSMYYVDVGLGWSNFACTKSVELALGEVRTAYLALLKVLLYRIVACVSVKLEGIKCVHGNSLQI
jgi:hypothetical protein